MKSLVGQMYSFVALALIIALCWAIWVYCKKKIMIKAVIPDECSDKKQAAKDTDDDIKIYTGNTDKGEQE